MHPRTSQGQMSNWGAFAGEKRLELSSLQGKTEGPPASAEKKMPGSTRFSSPHPSPPSSELS